MQNSSKDFAVINEDFMWSEPFIPAQIAEKPSFLSIFVNLHRLIDIWIKSDCEYLGDASRYFKQDFMQKIYGDGVGKVQVKSSFEIFKENRYTQAVLPRNIQLKSETFPIETKKRVTKKLKSN